MPPPWHCDLRIPSAAEEGWDWRDRLRAYCAHVVRYIPNIILLLPVDIHPWTVSWDANHRRKFTMLIMPSRRKPITGVPNERKENSGCAWISECQSTTPKRARRVGDSSLPVARSGRKVSKPVQASCMYEITTLQNEIHGSATLDTARMQCDALINLIAVMSADLCQYHPFISHTTPVGLTTNILTEY